MQLGHVAVCYFSTKDQLRNNDDAIMWQSWNSGRESTKKKCQMKQRKIKIDKH